MEVESDLDNPIGGPIETVFDGSTTTDWAPEESQDGLSLLATETVSVAPTTFDHWWGILGLDVLIVLSL